MLLHPISIPVTFSSTTGKVFVNQGEISQNVTPLMVMRPLVWPEADQNQVRAPIITSSPGINLVSATSPNTTARIVPCAHHYLEKEEGTVGIVFVDNAEGGRIAVLTVVNGGAAEEDGRIRDGDLIYSVDGCNVMGWSIEAVRAAIIGPVGSAVTIRLDRMMPSGNVDRFDVTLIRKKPFGIEAEELRSQLSYANRCSAQLCEENAKLTARLQEQETYISKLQKSIDEERTAWRDVIAWNNQQWQTSQVRGGGSPALKDMEIHRLKDGEMKDRAEALKEFERRMESERMLSSRYRMAPAYTYRRRYFGEEPEFSSSSAKEKLMLSTHQLTMASEERDRMMKEMIFSNREEDWMQLVLRESGAGCCDGSGCQCCGSSDHWFPMHPSNWSSSMKKRFVVEKCMM